MNSRDVVYEFCKDCRNLTNCLQILRKSDPFYIVKCPCFNALNLETIERRENDLQ